MSRPDFSYASEDMAEYEIEGMVLVRIGWIGEGYCGDFNEDDPEDYPLLRFDAYDLTTGDYDRGHQDSSYCTCLPAWTPIDVLKSVCRAIAEAIEHEPHWKTRLAEWSWVDPDDAARIHREYST